MEMKKLAPNEGLRLFDINWEADTAGPSPNNNNRIEVFLLGCDKAQKGNPCKGCFNSVTWDKSKAEWSWDPIELADMINEGCDLNNKYVTIGGGEPTDQIHMLIPFAKRLKEHGFHIIMYTWRSLMKAINHGFYPIDDCNHIYNSNVEKTIELLKYLDIVIDGEFRQEEKMYQQDLGDGMLSSIGSGNQIVWDIKNSNETLITDDVEIFKIYHGQFLKDLAGLYIKPDSNDLVYITKK